MSLRRSSRPVLTDLQKQVVTRDIGNLSASRWKKDIYIYYCVYIYTLLYIYIYTYILLIDSVPK
jgi:hypothetical protein